MEKENDIKFAKLEDVSLVMVGTMVISSENNIFMNLIDIPDELKTSLPEAFKEADEGVLLVFSDNSRTVSFSVIMPYGVAQKLAAVILSMGWLLSDKFATKGGAEHGVQGRSEQQEAPAFWEKGSEGEGAYTEPPNTSEQDKSTRSDESEEIKVSVNRPLPA